MRFRNPTVALLAIALPCTWYLARQDLAAHRARDAAAVSVSPSPATSPAPSPGPGPALPLAPVTPPLRLLEDATVLTLEAGQHRASAVVSRWAEALGLQAAIDDQIASTAWTCERPQTLDRSALRALLDARDVVLVRRDGVLHAVHRRNLAVGFGPPWALVTDAPADPDALVTRVVQVRHGAGASIFAVVRALLTRDSNRLGNILYVQGPEQILLCDFARNVRYYEQVIAALDVPALASTTPTTVE